MSAKRRVYEVARDLGMDNKSLLGVLETLGVPDVKNHMSVLSTGDEDRVKKHLGKGGGASGEGASTSNRPRVVKRRVVRRRRTEEGVKEESAVAKRPPPEAAQSASEEVSAKPKEDEKGATPAPAQSVAARTEEQPQRVSQEQAKETPAEATTAPEEKPSAETSGAQPAESKEKDSGAEAKEPEKKEGEAPHPSPESAPSSSASESASGTAAAPSAPEQAVASQSQERSTGPSTPSDSTGSRPEATGSQPTASPKAGSQPGRSEATSSQPAGSQPAGAPGASSRPAGSKPESSQPAGARASGQPPTGGAKQSQAPSVPARSSSPPKRGVEVWEGRPGVPMTHHRPGPRRVQYDAKAPPPGGARRGPGGRMMRGGGRQRGIGSFSKGRGGAPVTKERGAHKKVVRIEETVNLQTLAGNMGVKATDLLRKLMHLGLTGININSTLDADTAKIVAAEFGWDVEDVAVSEEEQLQKAQGVDVQQDAEEDLKPRPAVVTVMGHVDHGKTSLLDALRETSVATGEAGGITQHIGAYSVETERGKITFLDTPGHAAFTQMRARGAQATDIVVLVVAADDGVMPQTKEAITHAKQAKVPLVVAVNKCDKPDSQPERVRRELSESGLVPEEWGGETLFCEVSAHTKDGLPELLDKLLLQSEMLELRANPDKPGSGLVIEAQLDRGRGPLATVLVQEGTLRSGDVVLAGAGFGKVRAMHDWGGRTVKTAGPSDPVAIIGLSEVPRAGDQVYAVKDLKTAQSIAETRKVRERKSLAPSAGNKPRSLEEIAKLMAESEQLELKVIVKADVAGSAEAVSESLQQLSTEKVRVSVVLQGAGAITENDVNLAVAAGAIIVGFNSKPAGKAAAVAQREGIQIRQYSVIYNLLDDVKRAMEGLLAPKLVEKELGQAEVRQTFRISKAGTVCGCMVTSGAVRRGVNARLKRDGTSIWEGKIVGLKRFKDDVREVKEGFECGISLENSAEPHVGDVIEVFDTEEVKQKL